MSSGAREERNRLAPRHVSCSKRSREEREMYYGIGGIILIVLIILLLTGRI
jgi:hypothetical protein